MIRNKIWILAILVVASCLSDGASIDTQSNATTTEQPEVCGSETCKKIANEMMERMNKSINPCDNFYEFVCGNYSQNTVIPEGKQRVTEIEIMRQKIDQELKTIVENEITDSDPQTFKTFKAFYEVCLNEEQYLEEDRKREEKELLDMLKEHGGWPVVAGDSWEESKFDWSKLWMTHTRTGRRLNSLMVSFIGIDVKNPSQRMIYISTPAMTMGYKNYSADEKSTNALYKFMVETAVIYGADRARAEKELKQVLDFEIELSKIVNKAFELESSTTKYNPMTFEAFKSKYPFAYDYVNNSMYPYVQLAPTEIISIGMPHFLDELTVLINKTPKRVLVDFVLWRIISGHARDLSEGVRKAELEYIITARGNSTLPKKSKSTECMEKTKSTLNVAAGALYVRKRFDQKVKAEVQQLSDNVKAAFRQMLEDSDWMTAETKKQTQAKLDEMATYVAYPEEYLDDKFLDDYYKDMRVYPESYLKTRRSWMIFGNNHYLKNFRKPFVRVDINVDYDYALSAQASAYYEPEKNAVILPAGVLQGHLYNSSYPSYMNYAGIGNYIGHEFGHGYYGRGRRYFNSTTPGDLWDPASAKELAKRTECVVNQYANYSVKGVDKNVNGSLTLEENIGDIVGLKAAYHAYDKLRLDKGHEARLPGFKEYSPKQLFWISYANTECAKYDPKYLKSYLDWNPHSPSEFRVIGPLSSLTEFSKDFNCPVGSRMNPENKCNLW